MNWEKCKNYGLIDIMPNGALRLYYDRNYYMNVPNPNPYMVIESASWQGNSVIIRGKNQYGEPIGYMLRGEYEAQQIL